METTENEEKNQVFLENPKERIKITKTSRGLNFEIKLLPIGESLNDEDTKRLKGLIEKVQKVLEDVNQ